MTDDKLAWWEKLPLALVVGAQMLVIFRWYTGQDVPAWVVTAFGIVAAGALDGVVVTTTMGRRAGRESGWGSAVALMAAIFSALVALHVYGAISADAWLHAAYPVVTFVYAQHLAQRAQSRADHAQPAQTTVNVTQVAVNVPDTVAGFIRDRARALRAERPGISLSELATLLSTSRDTVRRALEGDEIPTYLPTPEGVSTQESMGGGEVVRG